MEELREKYEAVKYSFEFLKHEAEEELPAEIDLRGLEDLLHCKNHNKIKAALAFMATRCQYRHADFLKKRKRKRISIMALKEEVGSGDKDGREYGIGKNGITLRIYDQTIKRLDGRLLFHSTLLS